MGYTKVKVKVQSFEDIFEANKGNINKEKFRTVEVDTGAAYLCLPPDSIEERGLSYSRTQWAPRPMDLLSAECSKVPTSRFKIAANKCL